MQVGYIPGVWDLLHVGHLSVLDKARGLVDRLIVGVASDEIVYEDKLSKPIIPLRDRAEMLRSLIYVHAVMPYYDLDFVKHLDMLKPDMFIVGGDWKSEERHEQAEQWCIENDCRFIKIPRYVGESTSLIRQRIVGSER